MDPLHPLIHLQPLPFTYSTPTDPSKLQYYKDYIALTVSTIFAVVNQEDPLSRPFVPSSPSNGLETITEGWVAKNPQDTHYGDGKPDLLRLCLFVDFLLPTHKYTCINNTYTRPPIPE